MLGYQIDFCVRYVLRKSDTFYFGIHDLNKFILPTDLPDKWLVVLNYRAEHWVLLYGNRKKERTRIIFADSLGRDLSEYSETFSLALQDRFGADLLTHLPFPVQSWRSRLCGFYVIYWASVLAASGVFRLLYKPFSDKRLSRNDHIVTRWIKERFPTLLNL